MIVSRPYWWLALSLLTLAIAIMPSRRKKLLTPNEGDDLDAEKGRGLGG